MKLYGVCKNPEFKKVVRIFVDFQIGFHGWSTMIQIGFLGSTWFPR